MLSSDLSFKTWNGYLI